MAAYLEGIFIAAAAGEPMSEVTVAEAVAGRGLAGDRYFLGTGYYSPRDVCEITLIEAEALERMQAKFGVEVARGEHRRNLVLRGVTREALHGRQFQLGAVILEYTRSRPPCGYLERITAAGMTRALGEGPGFCVKVLVGGTLYRGAAIEVLPQVAARPTRWLP